MVARHTDWRHTRVIGAPPEAAAPYLPEARKLLGQVFEDAAFNNLGVHKLRKVLDDGTVIVAEKHGEIPRVTITPALPPPTERPTTGHDDFVVWARTTAQPDGIDAAHPQQILRPSWRTFFFDEDVAGFDVFPGSKGQYAGTFPAGVPLAGNIDWRNEAGERFSWYGPSSRYWYDDWRQPRAQYGKHVFNLGQILLDVDAYCTASDEDFAERYVMGASKVGASLYVVMAALPEAVSWPPPPASATQSPDAWSAPSYPITDIPLVLRRFSVTTSPAKPGPMKYGIAAHSHEDLWSGTVPRAASPWHFDAAGKSAVTHVPPASSQIIERGTDVVRPSVSHLRLKLEIAADGSVSRSDTAITLLPGGSAALLAEDGHYDLQIVRKAVGNDGDALVYRYAGHDYTALRSESAPVFRYDRRQIIWADLRDGTLLLWNDSIVQDLGWNFTAALILCRDGVETVLWSDGNTAANFGSGDAIALILARLAAGSVAPLALAHLHAFGVLTGGGGGVHDAQLSLLHAHYFVPFRKADIFGQDVFAFDAGPWTNSQSKVDVARDISANTQVDGLGHTTLPGFATSKGSSVFSYPMNAGINGRRIVLAHATGSTLADLTGVAGSDTTEAGQVGNDARYHPVWLLGKPPRAETT